jgi:hypothetical protein
MPPYPYEVFNANFSIVSRTLFFFFPANSLVRFFGSADKRKNEIASNLTTLEHLEKEHKKESNLLLQLTFYQVTDS